MRTLWILLLVAFVAFGAVISLLISSLFSLSKAQLTRLKGSHDVRARRIARLMNRPFDVLVTLLSLDVLGGILSQNAASNLLSDHEDSFALKVGVPWLLWVFGAELLPKIIGMQHNTGVALFAGRFLEFFDKVFAPPRKVIVSTTQLIAHTLFGFLRNAPAATTRELVNAVNTEGGPDLLTIGEKELITGVLNLADSQIRQIMTPRAEVVYFDVATPLADLARMFADEGVQSMPLVRGSLDHVLGILQARDFVRERANLRETDQLTPLLQRAQFVPETLVVTRGLMRQMQASDHPMTLVVDEYGVVTGSITLDDLLRSLAPNQGPANAGKRRYWELEDNALIASGRWELDDVERVLGLNILDRKNRVTLGGWLTDLWGEIPRAGSKLQSGGHLFFILAADPNRIRRVHIRKA